MCKYIESARIHSGSLTRICIRVCARHIYGYTCLCVYISSLHVYTHVRICVCARHIYGYMNIHVYVYTYVHTCTCLDMHTCTQNEEIFWVPGCAYVSVHAVMCNTRCQPAALDSDFVSCRSACKPRLWSSSASSVHACKYLVWFIFVFVLVCLYTHTPVGYLHRKREQVPSQK